jgi:hypothetical protein
MRKLPPPDAQTLNQIRKCASLGIRWEDIAIITGRKEATLQRNKESKAAYREGRAACKVTIAQSLFTMATRGRHPAATIFAAKVILGWREDGSSFADDTKDAATLSIPGAHFGKVKA